MALRTLGTPGDPVSPFIYQSPDYQGNVIRATVVFGAASPFTLVSVTMFRDAACVYKTIYFGLGADGTVNSTVRQFTIPAGTTVANAATLTSFGFVTVTDVLAGQITAGP